jgi:glycosyltransferase involved in cell wall biosynthesis
MINYTIIIPHKNIPKLLQRCLASIPRRPDVQIIIVDDNSDAAIVDFEHFPGKGDPCVEIVYNKGEEGTGSAFVRNMGMKYAKGRWLLFCDADDYFNYCIKDIFDEYVSCDADIVFFKLNSVDSDTYENRSRVSFFNTYIDYYRYKPKKAEWLLRYKINCVWNKLFKRSFLEEHDFKCDEVLISEDVEFSYLSGFYAKTIIADRRALYCVTTREGSIMRSERTSDKKVVQIYVSGKRYLFFKEHHIPLQNKISFIDSLMKLSFKDRSAYKKAKQKLIDLGFSNTRLFFLCVRRGLFRLFFSLPRKFFEKKYPDNSFIPAMAVRKYKK